MLFPTVEFALFFLAIFAVSWMVKQWPTTRKLVLLGASYYFYAAWDPRFVILLLEASIVNFLLGIWISKSPDPYKKVLLWVGIGLNLVTLGVFKYYGFFMESLNSLFYSAGIERDLPIMEVILPVGISFFTFQGLSYIVDVYRKEIKASRSLIDILLYVSFFPQLVAGPIVRAKEFIPQLERPVDESSIRGIYAFLLIGLGLFKKVVIAHFLAVELVNPAFESPSSYGSIDLIAAIYGYAVQIYCDFSAYSDMAIGFAALLGFHFPKNFNQPYRADSLRDFWHRWHISLSTWLRDYLYIPLGGSKLGSLKTYRNLFLTMLLGGLWHGAAWNFVFWGVLHGSGLGLEKMFREKGPQIKRSFVGRIVKTWLTFHFVCFAWIFFASESFSLAWEYLASMGQKEIPSELVTPFTMTVLSVGFLGQFLPKNLLEQIEQGLSEVPLLVHGAALGCVLVIISALGPGALAPFIYFRF